MTESPAPQAVALEEVRSWHGLAVDGVEGREAGIAHGLFLDAASGEPTWLVVKCKRGRFGALLVVVPAADCAGGSGRVWVAHGRDSIRSSPLVDPRRPLLREHELAISAHYEIGEGVGRAAAVAGRPAAAVTSQPGP
jgi:hypothetical protein